MKELSIEETSMMIDNILGTYKTLEDMLDLTTSQDRDILDNMNYEREWLNSLKDRVLPQPKQEWSEDVERIKNNCISYIENYKKELPRSEITGIPEVIEWLKSLRPQNTWKPSQGQLECLGYAIEKAEKDWSPLVTNRIYLTLKALKEQLEKL